jgi:hypothetical protein
MLLFTVMKAASGLALPFLASAPMPFGAVNQSAQREVKEPRTNTFTDDISMWITGITTSSPSIIGLLEALDLRL